MTTAKHRKKPYKSPKVRVFGAVTKLTKGGSAIYPDGGASTGFNNGKHLGQL